MRRGRGGGLPPTELDTPCLIWDRSVGSHGYGQRRVGGQTKLVHRLAVEETDGPIPEGMVVMHLCDNRLCYRRDHLRVATYAENNADAWAKGRASPPPRLAGTRANGARLSRDQVRSVKWLVGQYGDRMGALTEIGKIFGVGRWAVADIRDGRAYVEEIS